MKNFHNILISFIRLKWEKLVEEFQYHILAYSILKYSDLINWDPPWWRPDTIIRKLFPNIALTFNVSINLTRQSSIAVMAKKFNQKSSFLWSWLRYTMEIERIIKLTHQRLRGVLIHTKSLNIL